MELICPSCEARYSIPEGSIGEKGRQVSCMNCGHGWHAYPPLMLGAAEAGTAKSGLTWVDPEDGAGGGRGAPDWGSASAETARAQPVPAPQFAVAAAAGTAAASVASQGTGGRPSTSGASRSEQLAAIREMLAEVQSEERASDVVSRDDRSQDQRLRAEPAAPHADRSGEQTKTAPVSEERLPTPPAPEEDDDDEFDPLRRRMEQMQALKDKDQKPSNLGRMRKRHERKVHRKNHAEKVGSGAFLTGFLLISIIASVMIALYLLHPQIIARVPGTEAALTEYVDTIDGLRVSVAETYQEARGWIEEKLKGKV